MSSTGRTGLGVLRRLRLRDVVLWTLPPFVLALYGLASSVNDYRRMSQFDDWWSSMARVDHFAWWRARSVLRLPQTISLDQGLSVEDTQRALVDLRVDRAKFDAIASDPIAHAGESVKALLVEGNSARSVEVRLRGDTSVHWTADKQTLAIESARGEMLHGSRINVFSSKEVLAQFAANSMAQDFGLLAPRTEVVPLFLNQRFNGMFRTYTPLDETFLRNAGRIPGNIFRGDTAERGDYFKGLPRELFLNPYIWDRVAANDRPGAIGTAKLFDFVARVNRAGKRELPAAGAKAWSLLDFLNTRALAHEGLDSVSRLFALLDRDEIARLLALDLVVGDPWHTSGVHNHFWYEDSSSGLLHPIPWDLRMLDLENPPPRANFNRFWRAALRDPRVFAGALELVWKKTRDGALLATVTKRVEESWSRYRDGFEFDRLRSGPISDVGTPEQVLGTLRKNLAALEGWCRDARASVAITPVSDTESIIDVLVDGRASIEFHGLELGAGREASLTADVYQDGERFIGDRTLVLVAEGALLRVPGNETLLPGVVAGERLEREGINYRFFLQTSGPAPNLDAIVLRNALTGERVPATALPMGSAIPVTTSVHPWSLRDSPVRRVITLAGDKRLSRTLEVPCNTTLHIAPGTQLVLDPDVSIHCKGLIEARGTEAMPISISSSDPRRPWGSLALWGKGANMSLFQHVKFSGGGGALLDDVEYTGMVCVHRVHGVRFEDCEFSGNQRCDDALHADVADVVVSRCWFHDTNSDALDFDISTGTIEHCKVERAGNDGFDLMSCSPDIIANEIANNRDKGISVGEDSSPLIFANTIRGCQRGIEVKDRSSPVILDNTISENRVGVLARLKNLRYERGGWPRIVHTTVSGNEKDLALDGTSRLTEIESRIGIPTRTNLRIDNNTDWLYALHGIDLDGPALGAVPAWRSVSRATIVDEERFQGGWTAPEATWRRSGGVTSVRIDGDCLVVRLNSMPGELTRNVGWRLKDDMRTHWLVLEASATDIASAEVRLWPTGDVECQTPLTTRLEFGEAPDRFACTVVPLSLPYYTMLSLAIQPKTRMQLEPRRRMLSEGQLRIHRWFVVSAVAIEPGTAR